MKHLFVFVFSFVIGGPFLIAMALDWNIVVASSERVILAIVAAWGGYILKGIERTSKDGHDLANSFMLEQKRKHMISTALNAELTKDPGYATIAREAKDAYDAHKDTDDRMRAKEMKSTTPSNS